MVQVPSTAKSNLMNRVILMSPNRTKHCVYGYIYIEIEKIRDRQGGVKKLSTDLRIRI